MPGFTKHYTKRDSGPSFPNSRYDDPRGGRASALERNVLRYRAIEATVYLFYAEEIHHFMLTTIYTAAMCRPGEEIRTQPIEHRLQSVLTELLSDAEAERKLTRDDADALRQAFASKQQQGKKLKTSFAYSVKVGILTEVEAAELKTLLDYRNDIAHRMPRVMSDISRDYWAIDHVAYTAPTYKGNALDRLRLHRNILIRRAFHQLVLLLSHDRFLFAFAEHAYEQELRRLERLIAKQVAKESERYKAINAETNLEGTELVDDLSPRFPANHRLGRLGYGDEYIPATGHLTKRGAEICYRLFDLGKSPIAVAYLMGITLRSAERRRQGWIKAGGLKRIRAEVDRYDIHTLRRLPPG